MNSVSYLRAHTNQPITACRAALTIRAICCFGVSLAGWGLGQPGFAATNEGADGASSWQSRPYHLRSDEERHESLQSAEGTQPPMRQAVLNWKRPPEARSLTRSTPRPDSDDPFNNPFGDRAPTSQEVAAAQQLNPDASASPKFSPVPTAVATPAHTAPRTVALVSAQIEAATRNVPSPFVIDPRSEPTLADPRERPAPKLRQESQFKVRSEGPSAAGNSRPSAPTVASVSATVSRRRRTTTANGSPQAKPAPARHSRAAVAHSPLPPLFIRDTKQSPDAPTSAATPEYQISDPSLRSVKTAQFESTLPEALPPDALSPEPLDPSDELDDLFAPADQPEPAITDDRAMEPAELGEDADFNRPFETPSTEPPPEGFSPLLPSQPEEAQPPVPRRADQLGTTDRDIERDLESLLGDDYELQQSQAESSCDRVYNDRNCCEEEDACASYITRLRSKSIREIDLDISPPYMPLATGDGQEPVDVDAIRGTVPSRTWKDRRGRTITDGKLFELRNAAVVVQDEQGKLTRLPWLELSRDDQCFVTAWWKLPVHCTPDDQPPAIRDFALTTMTWTASALCHKPLYFQDVQLERYGHSAGPIAQPFLSGAHFFSSLALLPYNMGMYPPGECRYALGYYRPGNCAPWMISAFPLSKRGAISQAAYIGAMFGIFH